MSDVSECVCVVGIGNIYTVHVSVHSTRSV